jgi:restriction system protein
MPVPDFQTFLLPVLLHAADGQEHTVQDALKYMVDQWRLTEDDKRQLLPSGRQTVLSNRASWACTYLARAGLIERTGRSKYCITQRGREVLAQNPERINIRFLENYPEFVRFHRMARQDNGVNRETSVSNQMDISRSPREILDSSYQELRIVLAQELLEQVKQCSPNFFEQLVVDLLVAMGYGGSRRDAGQAIGQSGDGGIDGIIKEDPLGLDVVYVQAKRWERTVGRPEVQGFSGSLDGHRARKGVFITASSFTADARDYVNRIDKKIVLIDGDQLAQLMIDHGVGVSEERAYVLKKIDLDYFNIE